MTCRYFSFPELTELYDKRHLPDEIENGSIIGVTAISSLSGLIERRKIENIHESKIEVGFRNIESELHTGRIWMLHLDSENLSRVILEEEFFDEFCGKRSNPHDLTQRVALFYDSAYSYWTGNVYTEAFE